MSIGDFRGEIDHIGLVNLEILQLVTGSNVYALMQNERRICRHPVVHPVGGVSGTIVKHLPTHIASALPEQFHHAPGTRRRGVKSGDVVLLHDQSVWPERALGLNHVPRNIIRVGIEFPVPRNREGHVLLRKRGHGCIDNCFAGADQFVAGVTRREPAIDLGRFMRDIPVFAGGIRKTAPDNCDRGVVAEVGAERCNHRLLFGEERRIPKNRDGRWNAVVIPAEKNSARLLDRGRDPLGFARLRIDSQENFFPRGRNARDFGIEKGEIESALSRFKILPVLPDTHSIDGKIGQDRAATGCAGTGEGENTLRNLTQDRRR